ncbi:MAG TPA: substrate-binding domain-containing protein [Burkholderiaceae bacterium]|nr:substrate-binding domain-containing protein [Burkholderiaceae bacterium]
MKLTDRKFLVACAAVAAISSGAAQAICPVGTGTSAPDYVLYAAGGSAQANAFFVAVSDNMTGVDSYTDSNSGADSGSYRVLYGTTTADIKDTANTTQIPAGSKVLYFYKFNGGSYTNGIVPQVGAGVNLPYPDLALLQSSVAITPSGPGKPSCRTPIVAPATTAAPWVLTNSQLPDWGVADVEVGMFKGFNNATGNAGGTAKNTDGGAAPTVGATTGLYDNLFGLAVTHTVYTGLPQPSTGPCAAPAAPCAKTNFTRAEAAGILQGTISNWNQLYSDDGRQLPSGGIAFLDRGEGSGSKASGNQYFLCYPGCGTAAKTPYSANNPYDGTTVTVSEANPQDIAESSSTTLITDLKAMQAASLRAIGVLGLETPPHQNQVGGVNVYDFVKINGVGVDTGTSGDDINGPTATSYINVVKGNYDFYYQNSFNTRSNFLAGTNANAAFANRIKTTMTTAGFVGADVGGAFPAGVPGTLLDADLSSTLTKGMTMNTRNKVSTAPLQPKLLATSSGIPASSDPL